MNMSDMKNMIVLKNLPSNLVEEAIVILKENKKIHKYQTIDLKNEINSENKGEKNDSGYIVKEAEMLIQSYTERLEENSSKSKNNIKKLEQRYKNSIRINFFLLFTTILGIVLAII